MLHHADMRPQRLLALGLAALAMAGACDERQDPLTGTIGGGGSGTSSFSVAPATLSLTPGQTAQLTLTTSRAIGPYTWTSNQDGVATVSNTGLVSAVGTGTATITVTAAGDPTVSARSTVSVGPASP